MEDLVAGCVPDDNRAAGDLRVRVVGKHGQVPYRARRRRVAVEGTRHAVADVGPGHAEAAQHPVAAAIVGTINAAIGRDVDDVRVDRVVDELPVVGVQVKRSMVHDMRTLPAIIRFELSGCTLTRFVHSL